MANRKQNIQMKFWVTSEEKELIDENSLHRGTGLIFGRWRLTDISFIPTPRILKR